MSLNNPDARRALRSAIQAFVVLAMIATVWFNIERLDAAGTKYILGWCMIILLVGTLGYIMENGLRSISWKGPGGFEGSATTDAPQAAQTVANAAQERADVIAEEAKP